MDNLILKHDNKKIAIFYPSEKIQDIIDYLNICEYTDVSITTDSLDSGKEDKVSEDRDVPDTVPGVIAANVISNIKDATVDELNAVKQQVSESVVEVIPNKKYTIMSSSDFAEQDEQIPLVDIEIDDNGEVFAKPLSDGAFDTESYNIAVNSLKTTKGRDLKDRLLRVDKSLNHNDPFLSTELQRQNIISHRGDSIFGKKKAISDIVNKEDILDDEWTEDRKPVDLTDVSDKNLVTLANQILLTSRDELKALANVASTTEEDLVHLFREITGVDYYTNEIKNKNQYTYLLDLLGKSGSIYSDSNEIPSQNKYISYLRDLTEDLIEKVMAKKQNSTDQLSADAELDEYEKQIKNFVKKYEDAVEYFEKTPIEQRKSVFKSKVDFDELIEKFEEVTGVDFFNYRIIDNYQFNNILELLQDASDEYKYKDVNEMPDENIYIKHLKDIIINNRVDKK